MEDRRNAGHLERHVQTVLISLVTGGIMFSAGYFFTDKADKAATRVQLENLVIQVNELRADIRAMQQSFVRRDEFVDHEARIRKVEQAVMGAHNGR